MYKGVTAVTFNPYGTKNLLKGAPGLETADVTNYCNSKDMITIKNAENHVGRCYEIESKPGTINHHKIENMEPIENAIPTLPEDLQWQFNKSLKAREEFEYYKKTGKHMPIYMSSSTGFHGEKCAGRYNVSGYIRDDGTRVSSYTRTCGAKHSG